MDIRGFLLDIEGVLVADKRYRSVPGAVDFVRRLRAQGLPLRLVSNNTTDRKAVLVDKLRRAGFDFRLEEVHTCIGTAVERMHALSARRCFVLGSAELRSMFADEGFDVVDDASVDVVVVGLDRDLTWSRLQTACAALLQSGARLLALHRNRIYHDHLGRIAPSVGPIVEALVYATQVPAEVMGKPSPEIYRQALAELKLPPATVLMVSDDPLTDLLGARQLGLPTALVLSGKYADPAILEQLLPADRPDLVVPDLAALVTALPLGR